MMNIDKHFLLKEIEFDQGRKETSTSKLLIGICRQELDTCRDYGGQMTTVMLNRYFRLHSRDAGHIVRITPLSLAVFMGGRDVVDYLISRGADLDKVGQVEERGIINYVTPLLLAVQSHDGEMVKLLLGAGADIYLRICGQRIKEEEGGYLQYHQWIYTMNEALYTENMEIIACFLEYWDQDTVYGYDDHACLCYAIRYYNNKQTDTRLNIIKCVLASGGRLCPGTLGDSSLSLGPKICLFFCELIEDTFPLTYGLDSLKVECSDQHYQCLQLVCGSTYVHDGSGVYQAIREYIEFFSKREFEPIVDDRAADQFNWFMTCDRRPSSLKHISRVAIRNSVRLHKGSGYTNLSLPVILQQYLRLEGDSFLDC